MEGLQDIDLACLAAHFQFTAAAGRAKFAVCQDPWPHADLIVDLPSFVSEGHSGGDAGLYANQLPGRALLFLRFSPINKE